MSQSLKKILDNLNDNYNAEYRKQHHCFLFFKSIFRNSSRKKIINFLQALSANEECNELIRFSAIKLSIHYIQTKEKFSNGSLLIKILRQGINDVSISDASCESDLSKHAKELLDFDIALPIFLSNHFEKIIEQAEKEYNEAILKKVKGSNEPQLNINDTYCFHAVPSNENSLNGIEMTKR